jgi:hypothetical protein
MDNISYLGLEDVDNDVESTKHVADKLVSTSVFSENPG